VAVVGSDCRTGHAFHIRHTGPGTHGDCPVIRRLPSSTATSSLATTSSSTSSTSALASQPSRIRAQASFAQSYLSARMSRDHSTKQSVQSRSFEPRANCIEHVLPFATFPRPSGKPGLGAPRYPGPGGERVARDVLPMHPASSDDADGSGLRAPQPRFHCDRRVAFGQPCPAFPLDPHAYVPLRATSLSKQTKRGHFARLRCHWAVNDDNFPDEYRLPDRC
jgi:hypothetical protein